MSLTPCKVGEGECARRYLKEEPQHQRQRPETEARTDLLGVDALVRVEPFLLLHLLQLGGRREHTKCIHLDLAGCSSLIPHNHTGFFNIRPQSQLRECVPPQTQSLGEQIPAQHLQTGGCGVLPCLGLLLAHPLPMVATCF